MVELLTFSPFKITRMGRKEILGCNMLLKLRGLSPQANYTDLLSDRQVC
jgi:hypothetical protein